jgi:hypothetical protein
MRRRNPKYDDHRNFEINLTYRCRLRCHNCNRMCERYKIDDADVTLEQLTGAARVLAGPGQPKIARVKISGGEPTMHPQFSEAIELIDSLWLRAGLCLSVVVITGREANGGLPLPKDWAWHVTSTYKHTVHEPWMFSPLDEYGIEPTHGLVDPCLITNFCGATFETWGFTPCALASSYGRVLGFPVHSPTPVWKGWRQLCEHCIWSQSRHFRNVMWRDAINVVFPVPSKRFLDGLDRLDKIKGRPEWPKWRAPDDSR